ncbi:MAG: ion channel, partial [Saprospiraceae bacterium]|nr:ion channel [Saprospiraceae bacterium]
FLVGNNSTLNTLELIRDTFNMPATFNDLSIKELFQVNHCLFNDRVALKGVNIPEGNTSLPWPQLAGNKLTQQFSRDSFFNGKMDYADTYDDAYLDLLKNYSQLLRAYKNNGDSESYNACYTEMKDMVTRKAAFNFQQNPNTSTFFTLYLNRFLKTFCDYGTNPVKALIFSMYVILVFGLLYFVFPSDGTALWQPPGWRFWRKTERQAWMAELRNRLTMSKLRRGLVQFVNAVALSMNAFVTLGYGDMPARGVARYLAVLEGLTGWFLLSIFSASLISQILQ